MRIRSILAALLVLSLAVTPAAARAVSAVTNGQAGSFHSEMAHGSKSARGDMDTRMAAMPDCHRIMSGEAGHKPLPAKSDNHKNCPDCDKRGPCTADLCQLKCFKVLGAAQAEGRAIRLVAQLFDPPAPAALEPVSYEPRTPPPRA